MYVEQKPNERAYKLISYFCSAIEKDDKEDNNNNSEKKEKHKQKVSFEFNSVHCKHFL